MARRGLARAVRRAKWASLLPALLACTGPGGGEAGDGAAGAPRDEAASSDISEERPTPPVAGATDGALVDAVMVRVTGGVDTVRALRGSELTMSGGCDGRSRMSLGFQGGRPAGPDWTYLAFDTEGAVGTGETGSFAVEEIRWDHGTFVPDDLPDGVTTRVPNRFTGTGTLTLTTHDATMAHATAGTRRMTGTLAGDGLENEEGVTVDLAAEFDVHLSCGVSG